MEIKFSRKLFIFVCFAFFISNLKFDNAFATWKIEGNTLIIHNEKAMNLFENYRPEQQRGKYKYITITGPINSFDFTILETMSRECEIIDLSCVEITTIPGGVFQIRDNLKKIVLPKTLEVIKRGAFAHCINMNIESLPATLKIVESGAFLYCRELNLTVPETVTVQNGAFKYCPNVRLSQKPSNDAINTTDKSSQKLSLFGALLSLIKWS